MRLSKARVQNYRSIRDSGWFDIEESKTILVGPNEAGKTALLQALQQINPPNGVPRFDALRDYPRSQYSDIKTGKMDPKQVTVVEVYFTLEAEDAEVLPKEFVDCTYVFGRRLDNTYWHRLDGAPETKTYGEVKKDLKRLCAHVDPRAAQSTDPSTQAQKPSELLVVRTKEWDDSTTISGERAETLRTWLESVLPYVDEENTTEDDRYDSLMNAVEVSRRRSEVAKTLYGRLPIFVLFNNYFRVKPSLHLGLLAQRLETGILDNDLYDYGNQCLLKLLGFTARALSDLGKAAEPTPGDAAAFKSYRDQLDTRDYQLNAASAQLSKEIRQIWQPVPNRDEATRLQIKADGQYLKVVVEDDLGVQVELDQRSEGFQWLVSFFVVFFAEAADKYRNAILLLDEPGLSLHGLKQRDFRETLSRLAELNQTLYTTHSPFLVGPDELDKVRVVEMVNRAVGTKVHTTITASDSAALLPLQEALGYDLAQSLFAKQRNLVLEGLTDSWYLDATAHLLRDAALADLNDKVALITADSAGKVVYYATILHAHKLKVAALLDSDAAGENAAKQDSLVHNLGNRNILRTRDAYVGPVMKPEIEDLLRETLIGVAKAELGWDVTDLASKQPMRPIVDVFSDAIPEFSKYRLAKAYLRWTRTHTATDLSSNERSQWTTLIQTINRALK